jgi:hypothetical protein
MRRRVAIIALVALALLAALGVWAYCGRRERPPREPVASEGALRSGGGRRPAARGQIRIVSDPPGARIFLDGQDLARRTPDLFEAPAGRSCRIRLELEGHAPAEVEALLPPGGVRELRLTLTEEVVSTDSRTAPDQK